MIFYRECREKAAPSPPQSAHCVRSQIPLFVTCGDIFPGKFAAVSKAVPLGKVSSPQAMTEGVSPSRLPPQVKIASGGKKDYTIKNVCGAQAAGAEEMKHETTGLL